jgi:lysozyme
VKFSDAGLALLKRFEGCKLEAYPDPATGGAPWTIGYGSTRDVVPGMMVTQAEADARLVRDIADTDASVRAALPTSIALTDNQFSAFVCFAFNVKSWRTRPIFAHLARSDFAGALDHWLLYDKANGKEMDGLLSRREAERALFLMEG